MFVPGVAERESRPQPAAPEARFKQLLGPLHVFLTTPSSTDSREMRALEAAERVARSHEPVWITAAPGAGAAWFAGHLHELAGDATTFTRENCAPDRAPTLVGGRGTLFLCAPERLIPDHQQELLDYLRQSDLQHLDGLRTVPPFPRVIAWSQASPAALARSGRILPALAPALGRIQVTVPPLSGQRESLDAFARAMLEQVAEEEGFPVRRLTPGALATLRAYAWPGNLAELHALLERACLLADPARAELDEEDLPIGGGSTDTASAANVTPLPVPHRPRTMADIEEEAIRAAIEWNRGNLVRAARELRIGRATLYRKLKKYGIPTRAQRRLAA